MCCKGFFKRVLPFFLTFSLGLLIASFFVTVAAPNFQFRRNGGWSKHRQNHHRLESENQRLREENSQLKRQLADKRNSDLEMIFDVPPPPPPPTMRNSYNGR
jgi:hypothetical protein